MVYAISNFLSDPMTSNAISIIKKGSKLKMQGIFYTQIICDASEDTLRSIA